MNLLQHIPPDRRQICCHIARLVAEQGGRALLVGGCVRDGLLSQIAKDLDIEVFGLEAATLEKTLSRHFRIDTVGRAFGVFILKGKHHGIDIALPRRESKTGPRHNDFRVEGDPSMTPEEAALRRDFTINAISFDPLEESCLDPLGGIEDLRARRLRHVSDAFAEDPLRVLRGMQFIARFHLAPDPATIALCRGLSPAHLPPERLWEEWKKLLLKGEKLSAGLEFLRQCGWLQHFPELEALVGCPQDPHWHPEGDVWVHTGHCLDAFAKQRIGDPWEDLVVGLAVLCHDMGKPITTYTDEDGRIRSPRHDVEGVPVARRFLERLTRQKKIFDEVLPLVEQHMRPLALYRAGAGDTAVRRLAARVRRVDRLTRVAYADKQGRPPKEADDFPEGEWLLHRAAELSIRDNAPKPILLGRHLVELGIPPGPHFGKILDRCYQAQLNGAFSGEGDGLNFLRELLREEGWLEKN
ncbi:MAG: CCA tRNA nucleotidyltransferase [Opitutales bacterium]